MTQLLYPIFFKAFGVRRLQTMLSPVPFTINGLPRDSMVHFVSNDKEHLDVDTSKPLYGLSTRKILIDFPIALTSDLGNPKPHFVDVRSNFKPFLLDNRKFRFVKDGYLQINDPLTLFVCNYSYTKLIYRYAPTKLTEYFQWFNEYKTIFDKIESIAQVNTKNHFVFVDVPKELPGFGLFNIYKENTSSSLLKIFNTPEKLFVLDLFKWLDERRAELPNVFSGLSANNFTKVNLVFNLSDGRSTVINLGFLNSWIKGNENQTDIKVINQAPNLMLQKVLLKFLISLHTNVIVPQESLVEDTSVKTIDPQDLEEAQDIEEATQIYNQQNDITQDDEIDGHEYEDALAAIRNIQISTKADEVKVKKSNDTKLDDDEEVVIFEKSLDEQLKDVDQEIQILEDISNRKLLQKGIKIDNKGEVNELDAVKADISVHELQRKVYVDEDVIQSLNRQIETQVDFGLLSANDYRNLNKDIANFQNSKDPYGSGVIVSKAREIKPEILQLNEQKSSITGSELVQDKSMLQSSLLSFDQDYIQHVMKKDMLAMTHGLQKAGVVIRKHEIEVEHSALGGYEIHTLDLKPVDGQPSTVRYRVPVISEDGIIVRNGNRQFLRKQRIDVPLRKIKPTEVALTSYYGKTFVKLNPKKNNSSLEWMIKQLNIAAMADDGFIQRVNPAKVFDNNFEAPFIYNALADNFKSIVTDTFTLQFDHTDRLSMVNEVRLAALEQNGSRVVGTTKKGQPIAVDKNDIFHIYDQDNNIVESKSIYSLLQLDQSKAPVDYCEVNIFSKSVPVALILGYTLGFENLLKFLQVPHGTIEGRRIKDLKEDEFSISFKDYSYIFSRKDRVASSILAGFNEFDKLIKDYEVDDFNHKDIYLNLLESKGLGSIYMREIELLQQLFVDPITKGILEQMKEPVTFNGLLVRSAEMLQTYHHPDSQDMSAMRIRGYERISGAVYKEMVTAIRQFRNKNIAGRSKIDISPYQIWTSIMKDPAMKIVEDINPIQNLKESEIVTYSGEGGRGKDSMNKASRAYHKNDMGIVSEATVDSSDVGVNAYLSANPQFKDLRGLPILDKRKIEPSSLISTSALLAPGSDSDDIKRVNN